MAKILIVGCGDMGSRLARLAAKAGHEVHALRRTAFLLDGVCAHQGDVTQINTLNFPANMDYVFIILSPDKKTNAREDSATEDNATKDNAAAYQRTYLNGTEHCVRALHGQNIKRIFWISSSSVYAQHSGEWVNEHSVAAPTSATAQIVLAAENVALHSAWPATVIRFAGIYGPRRLRLMRWVESGRAVQAQPPAWTNRIHIEDCAALLFFLLEKAEEGAALATHYIGADSAPAPQHEVLDWLAAQLNLPAVPRAPEDLSAPMNKRLSNSAIKLLGFVFQFPTYQQGYRAVLLEKTVAEQENMSGE